MKDEKQVLTSISIKKDTLDKIRNIAKDEGMKIYGVLDKLLENYLKDKNAKWYFNNANK